MVKRVVEEQDRSKSFMVFGLKEEKGEKLNERVGKLLLELDQKPQIEVCRIGSRSRDTKEERVRPVKVTVKNSATE